ncbi:hypothetical protein JX265_010290 [Neoarthrinium moseri]|uniref:5'-Nucleotidase C-terminal domain-containing protein n=1 Tax=Neoarthrinium moseri TaxID=1658444 RepID=A0A9P9WEW2_9PEZI|nr:hypothetical protein JX265_010290 [Neoarthrinium moseri]
MDEIDILHFNDVYHTSDVELVPRFASTLSKPNHVLDGFTPARHQLRVFSGDAFSPSLEASVLHGGHMIDLLNALNIDVACYGNHDFDFGEARLSHLSRQTNFPWTLANAVRKHCVGDQRRYLAQAQKFVTREVAGYRLGFFGLAGTDWPSNCQHLPDCEIHDPASDGRRLAAHLRNSERCDFVIAVTHMRLAEDLKLSQATLSGDGKIDLILGGHDHYVLRRTHTDTNFDPSIIQPGVHDIAGPATQFNGFAHIIKSGTDWRGLSIVRLRVERLSDGSASISDMNLKQIVDLTKMPKYHQIPPCPKALAAIAKSLESIDKLVQQPLVYADISLEGRSTLIRSQESNLGNMVADAVRAFYNSDIALVNSGGIRCDRVIERSKDVPLCIRDILDISPFDNAMVVKRVSGSTIALSLENSVSDAHTDGRFMQVSGLSISVNWHHEEGDRILSIFHHPRQNPAPYPLQHDRMYTVAMTNFIAAGFDGYSCFESTETMIDVEGAMTDTNLLLEVFGGAFTSRDRVDGELNDNTTAGLMRARKEIVIAYNESDGLPVIRPRLEGRIKVISGVNL